MAGGLPAGRRGACHLAKLARPTASACRLWLREGVGMDEGVKCAMDAFADGARVLQSQPAAAATFFRLESQRDSSERLSSI